jgi:hypothetical protein
MAQVDATLARWQTDYWDILYLPRYHPANRQPTTDNRQPPADGTCAAAGDLRILETEFCEESRVIAQKIKARCDAKGWVPGQFAAASRGRVGATALTLDLEDEAFVNERVVPGHASSHGFNDPREPFFGPPIKASGA